MTKTQMVNRISGEIFILIPLFLIAWYLSWFYSVSAGMLAFIGGKFAYHITAPMHFGGGWKGDLKCFCVTYGIGLFVYGFITWSLAIIFPIFIANQPMLPVLLGAIVGYVNSHVGDERHEIKALRKRLFEYETKPPFKCVTASAEEIAIRGRLKGLDDKAIEFITKAHRIKYYRKPLLGFYETDDTEEKVYKRKQRYTKQLEA